MSEVTPEDVNPVPQPPPGVFPFVVDTVRVSALGRIGYSRRHPYEDATWVVQAEDDRGLAHDDPARSGPPMTVTVWAEPSYRPSPRQGLPEGLPPGVDQLRAPLALPVFRYVLRAVPPGPARYLTGCRDRPGVTHEGYQAKFWLGRAHAPGRGDLPLWLWLFLLDVHPPTAAPDPEHEGLTALWGTLGYLPDRDASVPRSNSADRVVSEELVIGLTTAEPPPPAPPTLLDLPAEAFVSAARPGCG